MEKLLKLASEAADQAEVYFTEGSMDDLEFTDGKLDKADSSLQSGIALRVVKNGRMGLAHTRNLLDREALVRQALIGAENGVEVTFRMPLTRNLPELETYAPAIDKLRKEELLDRGRAVIDYIKSRVEGQVNLGKDYGTEHQGVLNSAGTFLESRHSQFTIYTNMIFPGTGSGLLKFAIARDQTSIPQDELDELIELYRLSATEIVPPTRLMPVIFTPFTLFALLSRFSAASAPVNLYNRVSPLCGKLGEKIVSDKLSLYQDPWAKDMLSSVAFDSEGTPTRRLDLIKEGVFSGYPTDLNYAAKLGVEPSGNGFRGSVEALPSAHAINVCVAPGDKSLQEMISGIKEGLIVHALMGAHSGNVLNGDYSVGVSSGFLIREGKIVGRVKDCLLSGNAYDTLSHIASIENKCENLGSHKIPSILCENVSVAGN